MHFFVITMFSPKMKPEYIQLNICAFPIIYKLNSQHNTHNKHNKSLNKFQYLF
jgi:hypothetical protein